MSFFPTIHTTSLIEEYQNKKLDARFRGLLQAHSPDVVRRVVDSLMLKETLATYEIESETPDLRQRREYIELLTHAGRLDLNEAVLTMLQNKIIGSWRAEPGYRKIQNYVGQSMGPLRPDKIHYICPKPEDVPELMAGLLECLQKMLDSQVHPVVIAGVISFGFVFIHPFEDGNGRLHRFLIHHILSKTGFAPQGMIFPVSAVILKKMREYDQLLELVSRPLMARLKYTIDEAGRMTALNNEKYLYQYLDYTPYVEFLFACIEETIAVDFKEELDFITHYDQAKLGMQQITDMPDRLRDLFIRLVLQNKGKLSASKREHFHMLSDDEIQRLEEAVRKAFALKDNQGERI